MSLPVRLIPKQCSTPFLGAVQLHCCVPFLVAKSLFETHTHTLSIVYFRFVGYSNLNLWDTSNGSVRREGLSGGFAWPCLKIGETPKREHPPQKSSFPGFPLCFPTGNPRAGVSTATPENSHPNLTKEVKEPQLQSELLFAASMYLP